MDTVIQLGNLLNFPLVSIDLIPGDGQEWFATLDRSQHIYKPFLLSDGHLGVPEKVLFKLYPATARLFQESRRALHTEQGRQDAAIASSVILLTAPAHLSALNTRKTLISTGFIDPYAELDFIAALLCVKQCAAASILWHHRRWLLCSLTSPLISGAPVDDILTERGLPIDALRKELQLTSKICEVYPRNYYGWRHRILCLRSSFSSLETELKQTVEFLKEEYLTGKKWIESHVSDHSAMHFTCTLAKDLHGIPHLQHKQGGIESAKDSFSHARDLLQAYPTHESLWLYLRLTRGLLLQDKIESPDSLTLSFGEDLNLPAGAMNELVSRYSLRYKTWLELKIGEIVGDGQLARLMVSGPMGEARQLRDNRRPKVATHKSDCASLDADQEL